MPATQESALREEIAKLGEMLGETIRDIVGADSLCVVEDIRRLAWNRRSGQAEAARELDRLIVSLNNEQLRVVIRAFSIFLDLANLAEDRQRVRVLRERREQAFPDSIGESIPGAISQLKLAGRSAAEIQTLLDQLQIELVFTAHPTEAKRRSVRSKLRKIRQLLDAVDAERNRRLHDSADEQIRAELAKLWQTDVIRPWRPSVMQEVRRGLSMKPVLWNVIPTILRDFRLALAEEYPDDYLSVRPCVTFGSWIGGDRDGHPFVTPEVSEQTIIWLREAALELHLSACSELFESLSLSERQVPLAASLAKGVSAACDRWPQLEREVREIPPNEVCRRWLGMIHWRLRQTQSVNLVDADIAGMYASASELEADVTALLQSLDTAPCGQFLTGEVQTWLDQILTFGFHLARLDVRQDARQYRTIADELLRSCGLCVDPTVLSENERLGLLVDTLEKRVKFASDKLSNEARQAIALFQLLHRIMANFGPQALGGHVISMTHAPSDVMTVLWLWVQTTPEAVGEAPDTNRSVLPIIPLFETITDLKKGPEILEGMFQIPAYREYVRQQADRQTVMLGYSDSTKDGGYLSACWSLFQAQQQLQEVAAKYEIALTFFHGRGGSLGRGGGPAARSILSLPAGTFHGSLRLTEQGEVLAERYDDPNIAHRHLEQVVWSSLVATGEPAEPPDPAFISTMHRLDGLSLQAYRELVEQPDFVEFFRRATPIAEIEQLPMGSRPSRRRGGNSLSDLRAIPWVFSWTQCRCLIPAWYGFGAATQELLTDPESLKLIRAMYRDWPFFRATIDNAELALAKTDLRIGEEYARLVEDSHALARISSMISSEFLRARQAVLEITQHDELLDGTPWLKESIRVRNRYIDPLNLIQVELLRRARRENEPGDEPDEELQHLTRLTIKGLAAGLRTTG